MARFPVEILSSPIGLSLKSWVIFSTKEIWEVLGLRTALPNSNYLSDHSGHFVQSNSNVFHVPRAYVLRGRRQHIHRALFP